MGFSVRKCGHDYIIIGNSAAGLSAADIIRKYDQGGEITIVSDEKTFGYSRMMLPLYVGGGTIPKAMVIAPAKFYQERNIKLLLGDRAVSIHPGEKNVKLTSGRELPYDSLLIATGASSKMPDLPGKELPGIFPLRKLQDAEGILKSLASNSDPAVVVGGGLVGVKSLEALLEHKRKVHLIISSGRILSQMLDQAASDLFLAAFEKAGVTVHFHADAIAYEGKKKIEAVRISDGTVIPCALVIVGKGVVPNTEMLAGTGITLNAGIRVNDRMATCVPGIYAAGDVSEPLDVISGESKGNPLWPWAVEGGRVAGLNMAGIRATFSGAVRMNSVEALGVRVVSAGAGEGEKEFVLQRKETGVYRKLVVSGGRLKGFVLAGDIDCAGVLTSLVRNQKEISAGMIETTLHKGARFEHRLCTLRGKIRDEAEERRNM